MSGDAELPEVETVRRGLALKMSGRRIVRAELRRADLRRPFPPALAERLDGAVIGSLTRRGKYILVDLDADGLLLLHLGMSGRITAGDAAQPDLPHDHVVLTLNDGTVVRFNDARRFGTLDYLRRSEAGRHPLLAGLGPEPLEAGFDGVYLAGKLAGKLTSVKAALLDQRIVAGLGNIYVCEALYRARCRRGGSPERSAAAGPNGWSRRSARCSAKRSKPAGPRCATMCRPTANSAISSTAGPSTAARVSPAPAAIAPKGCAASSSPAARHSSAQRSSADSSCVRP